MGLKLVFLWVPAHISIRGNKIADRVAKEVTKRRNIDLNINVSKTSNSKAQLSKGMKEKMAKTMGGGKERMVRKEM